MPDTGTLVFFFQQQPFLAYSLLASIILFVVSLFSGLFRLDFISALGPRGLISIVISVISALTLRFLCLTLFNSSHLNADAVAMGLSRLPLYFITLALGPSAGLVAGILFLSLGNLLKFPDLILLLELSVLGWFAISPSPRLFWWAGSLGVIFSYALTWAAAGSAYLQLEFQNGSSLAAHLALHQDKWFSLAVVTLVLAFVRPKLYERFLPFSHIAPEPLKPDDPPLPERSTEPEPLIQELFVSRPKTRTLNNLQNLHLFDFSKDRTKIELTEPILPQRFERNRQSSRLLEGIELPNLPEQKN